MPVGAALVAAFAEAGVAARDGRTHGDRLGGEHGDLLGHRLDNRDADDALALIDPIRGGEGLAVGVLHLVQGGESNLSLRVVITGGLVRDARGVDADEHEDEERGRHGEVPADFGRRGSDGGGAHFNLKR